MFKKIKGGGTEGEGEESKATRRGVSRSVGLPRRREKEKSVQEWGRGERCSPPWNKGGMFLFNFAEIHGRAIIGRKK